MKKILTFVSLLILFAAASVLYSSCAATSPLSDAKSGAQLWGENCLRCHNAPSPETFSDVEWDVAVMHMRMRANLTDAEVTKIVEFLKTAN